MINEQQSISVVLLEARNRIDGKVMYFCVVVSSLFLFFTLLGYDIGWIKNQSGKYWPLWLVMPLIQFGLYVRFRQDDLAGDGKVGQFTNALFLILAQFAPFFFLGS